LVPATAISAFLPTWGILSLIQPFGSLAFLSDGALWGTGDYGYLRNAMIVATLIGIMGIWLVARAAAPRLIDVWVVSGIWVMGRAVFGMLRIWPGIGNSVFKATL